MYEALWEHGNKYELHHHLANRVSKLEFRVWAERAVQQTLTFSTKSTKTNEQIVKTLCNSQKAFLKRSLPQLSHELKMCWDAPYTDASKSVDGNRGQMCLGALINLHHWTFPTSFWYSRGRADWNVHKLVNNEVLMMVLALFPHKATFIRLNWPEKFYAALNHQSQIVKNVCFQ